MQTLVKNSDNATVTKAFSEEGIEIDEQLRVICILPTKDKVTGQPSTTKSTVFAICAMPIGERRADYKSMSAMERIAQKFSENTLLRGRLTFDNEVIEAMGLKPGAPIGKEDDKATLRIYEQYEPFFDGQNPVRRRNKAGDFEDVLKNGKKFYRDTKVVLESELRTHPHQLIPDINTAGITE